MCHTHLLKPLKCLGTRQRHFTGETFTEMSAAFPGLKAQSPAPGFRPRCLLPSPTHTLTF